MQDRHGTNQKRNFRNDLFPSLRQYHFFSLGEEYSNVIFDIKKAYLAGSNITDFGLDFLLGQTFSLIMTDIQISLSFDQTSPCKLVSCILHLSIFSRTISKVFKIAFDSRIFITTSKIR